MAFSVMRLAAESGWHFEFRHSTWFAEETFAILKRHQAALCVAESDELESPDAGDGAVSLLSAAQERLFAG